MLFQLVVKKKVSKCFNFNNFNCLQTVLSEIIKDFANAERDMKAIQRTLLKDVLLSPVLAKLLPTVPQIHTAMEPSVNHHVKRMNIVVLQKFVFVINVLILVMFLTRVASVSFPYLSHNAPLIRNLLIMLYLHLIRCHL